MKKLIFPVIVIVAVISLTANILLYYRYSSSRPIITVNGEPITRKQFEDKLEFLYGRQLLTQMIWQKIVLEAAAKNNCLPTDQDVLDELEVLQRTTPNVIETARDADPSLRLFKDDLKANLALRNLRMVGISVSPEQIESYYDAHKDLFKLPQQTQTTLIITNDAVDADTATRMLRDNISPTVIARQPNMGVIGINAKLDQKLPTFVGQEVLAMKIGEVKTIPIDGAFAVVQVKNIAGSGVPPLEQVADQARIAAILAEAPSEDDMLRKLLGNAQIVANVDKYAEAIPTTPGSQLATPADQ